MKYLDRLRESFHTSFECLNPTLSTLRVLGFTQTYTVPICRRTNNFICKGGLFTAGVHFLYYNIGPDVIKHQIYNSCGGFRCYILHRCAATVHFQYYTLLRRLTCLTEHLFLVNKILLIIILILYIFLQLVLYFTLGCFKSLLIRVICQ